MARTPLTLLVASSLALLGGCSTKGVGDRLESAGEAVAEGAPGVAGAATSLVNVNLSNVLNDMRCA